MCVDSGTERAGTVTL